MQVGTRAHKGIRKSGLLNAAHKNRKRANGKEAQTRQTLSENAQGFIYCGITTFKVLKIFLLIRVKMRLSRVATTLTELSTWLPNTLMIVWTSSTLFFRAVSSRKTKMKYCSSERKPKIHVQLQSESPTHPAHVRVSHSRLSFSFALSFLASYWYSPPTVLSIFCASHNTVVVISNPTKVKDFSLSLVVSSPY